MKGHVKSETLIKRIDNWIGGRLSKERFSDLKILLLKENKGVFVRYIVQYDM
jgi:hypothetical protein